MSDRSSSDIQNRSIVKNPLLLSAVTGLSFEDLTHNAVLLPVTPSQGVIPSQGEKVKNAPLGNPNLPSGDAPIETKPTVNLYPNPTLAHTSQTSNETSGTLSNASKKSKDDFDVNEYFARLHGTRYVSAPLNSNLKENKNANLDESDSNLEEINLNETDKGNDDTQQSITADIAQNFSQLPTMLPQVASAVFNSFSNILSMKSREETPEVNLNRQRQEMESKQESVSFSVAPELSAPPREVAQPPKEPPIMSGASNYRITTKKKAYAQIPGLSSREPPTNFNPLARYNPQSMPPPKTPSFFVPHNETSKPEADKSKPLDVKNVQSVPNFQLADNNHRNVTNDASAVSFFNPTPEAVQANANTYVQSKDVNFGGSSSVPILPLDTITPEVKSIKEETVQNTHAAAVKTAEVGVPKSNIDLSFGALLTNSIDTGYSRAISNEAAGLTVTDTSAQVGQAPTDRNIQISIPASNVSVAFPPTKSVQADLFATNVIPSIEVPPQAQTQEEDQSSDTFPPPPVFQNLPRKVFVEYQNQTTVGKSILPPSVARRLASHQPVIKQNVPPLQSYQDNIFVPAPIPDTSTYIEQNATSSISTQPLATNVPLYGIQSAAIVEQPLPTVLTPTVPSNTAVNVQPELKPPALINAPPKSILPPLPQSTLAALPSDIPPPPTFFNPSKLNEGKPENVLSSQTSIPSFTQNTINPSSTQLFETTAQEPPKFIPLPPKASGSHSYRLVKKRPQYYSGPIEGIGAISSNVKPLMPPTESSSYHGAMFSPETASLPSNPNLQFGVEPNLNLTPFDICKPVEALPPESFVLSQPPIQPQLPTNYDTAFDFSRPTTENYSAPKDEGKGFGIIGSLKSKLSSIDINKLQDKVTTFFDPAYNDTKVETQIKDNAYRQLHNPYETTNQSSSFDIFVPVTQQTSDEYTSVHGYGYPTVHYSNYNQNLPTQYYQVQNANNFNSLSYYTNQVDQNSYYQQTQVLNTVATPANSTQPSHPQLEETASNVVQNSPNVDLQGNKNEVPTQIRFVPEYHSNLVPLETDQENLIPASTGFDQPTDIVHSFSNLQITQDSISVDHYITGKKQNDDNFTATLLFDSPKSNAMNNAEVKDKNVLTSPMSTGEMFSFDQSKDSGEEKMQHFDLSYLSNTLNDEQKASENEFRQSEGKLSEHGSLESGSDLNIYGTCSEVSKSEDKDNTVEDLTTQLIENITSPIQLLNPVEVPLTENNSPVDAVDDVKIQRTEISHISDETIETLNVHAGHGQLEENRVVVCEVNNYGWADSERNCATNTHNVGEINNYGWADSETNCPTNDHNTFDFQANPETIGILGNISLFSNMPVNASDELKAEFKYTADDNAPQIPSAPELEEDTQSDEATALDVNSIEQDATKDFPVFEEDFVIEPSETDDDKIESITGRRSSSENVHEFETFTNRVDKYKKMEESIDQFDIKSSQVATSPALTIASYFDTGNYAVEAHYRNSFSSPSNLSLGIGSPNMGMSIPPGFEEEFKRRLSGLSSHETFTPFLQKQPANPNTAQITSEALVNYNILEKVEDFIKLPETQSQTHVVTTNSDVEQPSLSFNSQYTDLVMFSPTQVQSEPTPALNTSKDVKTDLNKHKYEEGTSVFLQKNDMSVPDIQSSADYTNTAHLFNMRTTFQEAMPPKIDNAKDIEQTEPVIPVNEDYNTSKQETKPAFTNVFAHNVSKDTSPPERATISMVQKTQQLQVPDKALPDPINFFSSPSPTPKDESDRGFNRLASYFRSPAKTEPSKPFFELSQSQNHYRHASYQIDKSNHKSFFDVGQSENHYKESRINLQNIPHEQYIANLILMKDLTAPENMTVPDSIVKSINYLTVEYDNLDYFQSNRSETKVNNITQTDDIDFDDLTNSNQQSIAHEKPDEVLIDNKGKQSDDKKNNGAINILENCKYCCEFVEIEKIDLNDLKEFKVKKSMNTETDTKEAAKSSEPTTTVNSVTVNLTGFSYDETDGGVATAAKNTPIGEYTPVKHHWFYRVDSEGKSLWKGFSAVDNDALEAALDDPSLDENTTVPTDGGRYDVNVLGRLRIPVYWTDKPTNVERCSWFYKGTTDARYVPYSEDVAIKLEEEYRLGVTTGSWHRRLQLPRQEAVVMHSPTYIVHLVHALNTDAYTAPTLMSSMFNKKVYRNPPKIKVVRSEVETVDHLVMLVHGAGEYRKQMEKNTASRDVGVRRGCSEHEIEDAAPSSVDHLLLLCHGVGSACDLRFRSVEEVVDDFRTTTQQLLQSHYKNSYDLGIVGRVEVLPISWHTTLHSGERGVDRRLAQITLNSIPRLRNFTNDTVLDVLFYTSPVFCQTILDTVCSELNRIYRLFRERNPGFKGGVSLGGHSLGSVILYDLLCHQESPSTNANHKSFVGGGHSLNLNYPQLEFEPDAMYAMGSPIAIFECIRGVESLGLDFALPTCKHFFNIFHPYDPIAYRIEPLINPSLKNVKPFLIPHHKGRKRMHLELRDTVARVGAGLKARLLESARATWASVWRSPPSHHLEKVVEEEMEKERLNVEKEDNKDAQMYDLKECDPGFLGLLNSGRRVDHVLQEAPLEIINEYLFAMGSHVCYWESEDTMLMILREIYDSLGVQPDCTVPQQTMTVQRTRVKEDCLNKPEFPSTSRDSC